MVFNKKINKNLWHPCIFPDIKEVMESDKHHLYYVTIFLGVKLPMVAIFLSNRDEMMNLCRIPHKNIVMS